MKIHRLRAPLLLSCLALAACSTTAQRSEVEASMFSHQYISEHRDGDDLLTAGLGAVGLRTAIAPEFSDPEQPTVEERRRRAIWSNWRGIADLVPGAGYGDIYGSLEPVSGREFSALARLSDAHQPHRVLAQIPDHFDGGKRCVVVTASSGSRGVYGAISVAGAWGLPRGCAVAYTDKGTGSDYFDLDAGLGFRVDGSVGSVENGLAFVPDAADGTGGVAFKHAHSQDNPEADWGRHVRQAAEFALEALNQTLPAQAPFTFGNTRIIAVGISNAGGAVLRAAELEGDWLDAVVAGEPNVFVGSHGSRTMFDYATEAALLMPCALAHRSDLPQSHLTAAQAPQRLQRCNTLKSLGLVEGDDWASQSRSAWRQLQAGGWTEQALRVGTLSVDFDLWRGLGAGYSSAYGRYRAGEHPCGFHWSPTQPGGDPRPATAEERAAWWSDGSGIPPGNAIDLIDPNISAAIDPHVPGLQCLRALWTGDGDDAQRVREGVAGSQAGLPANDLPIVLVHGVDDGLIPMSFTSTPYAAWANENGRDVRLWQVRHAQHFDAFLALPAYRARYVPLLPYVYEALDRVWVHLEGEGELPADAVISPTPSAGMLMTRGLLAFPD